MNDDKGYKIFCSRCGAEMSSNSRYCMKCGNLNYDHEANKNMRLYLDKDGNTYQVGDGNFITKNDNKSTISVGNNTGNRSICFFVNYGIYMFILLINILLVGLGNEFSVDAFINSSFPYMALILSISFLYAYSLELIFMKSNERWWSALIPVYNFMVLAKITFGNKYLGLVTLVPFIGQLFLLVMLYKLGTKFKFNGFLTAILSIFFLPIIGFGSSLYEGHNFIDYDKGEKTIEVDYKYKKIFLITILLFFMIGIASIIYIRFSDVESGSQKLNNYYYVYAADKIFDKTQTAIKDGKIKCELSEYSNSSGVYYFEYPDFRDYIYLPFYYLREPIEGYMMIDNTKGDNRYYISLTDGKYGISEMLIENVDSFRVTEFVSIKEIPDGANICDIIK